MSLDLTGLAFALGGAIFIGYGALVMMTGTLYRNKRYESYKNPGKQLADRGKPQEFATTFANSPGFFSFEVGLYFFAGVGLSMFGFFKSASTEFLKQLLFSYFILGIPTCCTVVYCLMKLKTGSIREIDELEYWQRKVIDETPKDQDRY